ncbi:long-chain fatty acid--CoA ligase [Corynebacterium sp. ES2794-CONJ1]|uniref:AMP-dependent synthetase/ligase n=1 Tax=unclassified Corynebacterium TaxID=2624378 RepID=UPI002167422E|nr:MULTISPECIES: long-chain fatty acid--CoA ligase [unclassified Corynebacterium]MCS4490572.1 long-chain fatty acid--CoA ligase [Corynebacterium sp. ES2775-CONJ]MCS4492351.1 long-chain fatty acid--CoA ligase [Corynebacterium sp. ES2715-CONJ3]MCS4532457.1 long-chain fatty acid--CoA ligase [Corynebacterium sp. ES2730-CONJ]MCU9519852.1 long-chain fatty acid--CoA ligase [Corynebacterium sp. ES2794-CONJ1]
MQLVTTEAEYTIGKHDTCLTALMATAKARPYGVMFTRPKNFEWVNVSAKEFIDEVFEVAKGFVANGVQQGDRIALLSETRYEWSLLDFAIWAAGAVSVPIYGSSSISQVQWIIEDSGAVFAVTETREHTELMKNLVLDESGTPPLLRSTSQLRRVLEINASAISTLKFEGRDIPDEDISSRIAATKSSDLASLVYTSGTTGRPKGCRLTHKNWLAEAWGLLTNKIGSIAAPGTQVLTFLPLAHVFSRSVSLAVAISGATQSHWSDFSTLGVQFQRSRPNLILGVPRVFEKVRNSAAANAAEGGPVKAALFARAERVAIEYSKALDDPEGPSRVLKIKHAGFDKLIYAKIRQAMGDSVKYAISGGSAMDPELMHFFRGIGARIYEGYGLTETAAAVTVDFENQRIGTVGPPIGGMSVRIAEDSEILIQGPTVFDGYWNNPEATDKVFDEEGWFHTEDLGELSPEGHLIITGRQKDLIVTAGGKNVYPGPMEDSLRSHPLISQAMVVGDGKPFVGLLVTLDEEAMKRWKLNMNIPESRSIADLATNPMLRAEIQDAVNQANASVSHAEAIKKFYILDRDLTEGDDELTPTMKVKRAVVQRRYAAEIEHLYQRNQ